MLGSKKSSIEFSDATLMKAVGDEWSAAVFDPKSTVGTSTRTVDAETLVKASGDEWSAAVFDPSSTVGL